MEALLIILANLLFAAIAPALAIAAGLLAAIVEVIVAVFAGLISLIFGGKSPKPQAKAALPVAKRKRGRWLHGIAVVAGVVAGAVLVVNFFFFQPTLRFALGKIGERTGYDVAFEAARGNLLTGTLAMDGVRVTRDTGEGLAMDVTVDAFAVDAQMTSLLSPIVTISSLEVSGVGGSIAPGPKVEGDTARTSDGEAEKRDFVVADARLSGIDLEIAPPGKRPHHVELITASAAPFRSRSALFDLFFRSNLQARIDGIPLVVQTEVIAEPGRRTLWAFEDVPVATLAALTDRAPISWLQEGRVTARVEDEWRLDDTEIDMDWQIVFSDVGVGAPRGAGMAEALLAEALARSVNDKRGDADLSFTMRFDREGLEAGGSNDLGVFWEALKAGVAQSMADRVSAPIEDAEDRINELEDRLRGLFDRN